MTPPSAALDKNKDDDYVISLLKNDAAANQKRYLSNGLGSLLSRRPTGTAPKPNTRFLKSIIRETDTHNAALKAKEEEDSKAKLKELKHGAKRGRDDGAEEGSSKRRRGEERRGRWAGVLGSLGGEGRVKDNARKERDARMETEPLERTQLRAHDRRKRGREYDDAETHRRAKTGGSADSKTDGKSPAHRKERRRRPSSRSRSRSRSPTNFKPRTAHDGANDEVDSDSDPLETFLGPRPPPKTLPRGRGAFKPSGIETRFDPSYDPKSDIDLEQGEERDDWDMALEALRDRAKWRKSGAERLKAAGFTDEEVKKWEKGGAGAEKAGEKDFEDIRWSKKGENREWDRGKVVDEDGDVDVKAAWA